MAKLNTHIIRMLSLKVGTDITTPAGAALLRHDIEAFTGFPLGLLPI